MTTYKAKGLNAITIRDDGKAVRLEFDTAEGGVAVAMPASAITALLPSFQLDAKAARHLRDAISARL